MIATVDDLEVEMLSCLQTLELRGNKLRTPANINIPSLKNLFVVRACLLYNPYSSLIRDTTMGVNTLQTWGSSPFLSPSLFALPPLSPSPSLLPLPFNSAGGLGSGGGAVSSLRGSEQSPATTRILVHLEVKIKLFSGQISCIL